MGNKCKYFTKLNQQFQNGQFFFIFTQLIYNTVNYSIISQVWLPYLKVLETTFYYFDDLMMSDLRYYMWKFSFWTMGKDMKIDMWSKNLFLEDVYVWGNTFDAEQRVMSMSLCF